MRMIGEGAMGRVLLAHDAVLDREVAVKLLRDDLKIPTEQREALFDRMRHEARASARVTHPNIVALFDMGDEPAIGLYLVFEFAQGTTLKERVKKGPLGPHASAGISRGIGDALTTAHAAGVLHRDIKPENIILTRTGPKIADFGIARVPDSTLTRDGGLLGTPAYSSPESIDGGEFSPLSDQFSMAATLYEAISARRAFPGDDAVAVAARIKSEQPAPIAAACGLDPHVDEVLLRGMAKRPLERFESCNEFGNALAEALELSPRTAMATLPDELHQRRAAATIRRRLYGALALGAAAGALVVSAGAALRQRGGLDRAAIPTQTEVALSPPAGWLAQSPTKTSALPSKRPMSPAAGSPASREKNPERPRPESAKMPILDAGSGVSSTNDAAGAASPKARSARPGVTSGGDGGAQE